MLVSLVLIAVGLLLLGGGGEVLLRGAVGLASLARLTPAVIGLTVVAAGTSVPELAVSTAATARGQVDITVGNVVGSNVFNATFILGMAALICPLAISGNTIRLEYPVVLLVTLLCVAVCGHGVIGRLDGLLFVAAYAAFTAYTVGLVRDQVSGSEAGQFRAEAEELAAGGTRPRLWVCVLLVAVGVGLLAVGAELTVRGASDVGRAFGLSERVIGLTIVGVGTGLPEVVTSLVSSVRGRGDVAIGNVLGSNLFNILGILGVNALVGPLPIDPTIAASDCLWMLGVTALLYPLMVTGRTVGRTEGGLLIALYVVYLGLVLARP